MTPDRIHVFYTDRQNGWAVTVLDHREFQIGEAEYHYQKSDAVDAAKGNKLPVHVFGRNGIVQRIIKAEA